jgi:hypothetical protein
VKFCPPKHRQTEKLPRILVWVIQAVEKAPPEGVAPIEWLLVTTVEVSKEEEAIEKLQWYGCRWGIEVFHKIKICGCRIKARQLETVERLKRCLPVFCVVAWRIYYTTMLSRACPEVPCTVVLDPEEWQALYCRIHQTAVLPEEVPTLRQAVRWIARLGGFLDRKSDGESGVTVLGKGFQHLLDSVTMYRILRPPPPQ